MNIRISFVLSCRLVLCACFLLSFFSSSGQDDCLLRKDEDSVKVYTCTVEDLKFKSIKAAFSVNTTLATLTSFILDIERYHEWQYNTTHPRIITRITEKRLIYYTVVEAPWPVSDRDMVVDLSVSQDPQTKAVTIITNGVPDYIPREEGFVRVPMSFATWTIKRVSPTKLSVVYTIKIDPGGSVPAWMVNMVCAEAPYVSFRNLREKISAYGVRKLPFIVD